MLLALVIIIAAAGTGAGIYLQQPQFDAPDVPPSVLSREAKNSHYADARFDNQPQTPVMADGKSTFSAMLDFLLQSDPGSIPDHPLPHEKTDLHALNPNENVVVWMGHDSVFIQMDGHTFLIDPVFSQYASPVPHTNGAFPGSDVYKPEDMPAIDYLLISHDHWDHLDYPTVHALQPKVRQVIVPLGIGSYFRQWGYDPKKVHEMDWDSEIAGKDQLAIHVLPAQHFSGRMTKKNQTLWASYGLVTPQHRIYISGDSGYGPHFKKIGQELGPFDLAILENGQYSKDWPLIHMMPEQTAQAGVDLRAKMVMPEHNSKFKLAHHPWNEPMERLSKASVGKPYKLLTPMIGQPVFLDKANPNIHKWWHRSVEERGKH